MDNRLGKIILVWGKKGVGKTLCALNSPFPPIHVIDTENSSYAYHENRDRLIKMGILKNDFSRASCPELELVQIEIRRIAGISTGADGKTKQGPGVDYGTIVIDTGGQWSDWIATFQQANDPRMAKQSQVVWGDIRSKIRKSLLALSNHCEMVILTAHERQYGADISPRANPSLLEVAEMSVRLVRDRNKKLPEAHIVARLPWFPPRVPEFTIASLFAYEENPVDMDHLKPEELVPPERIAPREEESND